MNDTGGTIASTEFSLTNAQITAASATVVPLRAGIWLMLGALGLMGGLYCCHRT